MQNVQAQEQGMNRWIGLMTRSQAQPRGRIGCGWWWPRACASWVGASRPGVAAATNGGAEAFVAAWRK